MVYSTFVEGAAMLVFGLVVGSFLNAVIYRLEKGESAMKGRSYCPRCKRALAWHDLVPLLSFLLLRGRCRYCKKQISLQYPLVELGTGAIFTLVFWHLAFNFFVFGWTGLTRRFEAVK